MYALLVLALLPLDVTAPPGPRTGRPAVGLALTAEADGPHVVARLTNGGPRRVKLWLGETCGGPTPFEAVIDGVAHPFAVPAECDKNVSRFEWLQPGQELRVPSTAVLLDGRPHQLKIRYHASKPPLEHDLWRGELESPPIAVGESRLSV